MKKLLALALCLALSAGLHAVPAVPGGETGVAVKSDGITVDFLHLDSSGNLMVTGGGGGGGGTSSSFGSAFPSAGTAIGVSNGTNMIALTLGQAAAASSVPVALANEDAQDQYITGQASQSATVNNIIPATSGIAATDTMAGTPAISYRSFSVAVIASAGISAGAFTVEGSMDNVNFVVMNIINEVSGSPSFVSFPQTVAASTNYYLGGACTPFRYVRVRISTAITGGTIQCFTRLSMTPWANYYISTPQPVGGRAYVTLPASAINGNNNNNYLPLTSNAQMPVHLNGDPTNDWFYTSGSTPITGTTATIQAAQGTGIRNYPTDGQFFNTSTTVATTVLIEDGSTVVWAGYLPEATVTQGSSCAFHIPSGLRCSTATALNLVLGTTGASVSVNVQGYHNN